MTTTKSPLLELKDVDLHLSGKYIIKNLSLVVESEETLVIMGQSGSGKSTLLRLILGILPVESGSILFKGKELARLKRKKLNQMRTQIGMVYQYSALLSSKTVAENIALPLQELTDKSKSEIAEIIDAKLELVGLKDVKKKLPGELSGGMRKRVGLARALTLEPELVLFDEPSSGLDPINSVLIDDLIISLREQQNVTSIVVSHELDSAFRIATRIAMLHEGKLVEDAKPPQFRRSKQPVVREFLSAYSKWEDDNEDKHADTQK